MAMTTRPTAEGNNWQWSVVLLAVLLDLRGTKFLLVAETKRKNHQNVTCYIKAERRPRWTSTGGGGGLTQTLLWPTKRKELELTRIASQPSTEHTCILEVLVQFGRVKVGRASTTRTECPAFTVTTLQRSSLLFLCVITPILLDLIK